MNEIWLAAAFFAFVLTAVLAAGYFYQRSLGARNAEASGFISEQAAATGSQAVVLDLFRSIGENFPAAKNDKNRYRTRLGAAGYRWESALPVFYGMKCGSALFAAGLIGVLTLLYRGAPSATLVPMACGLGLGFVLPDRILASRARARARRLRSGMPAALDLLVLAMEAGQSLDQAIADASLSLKRSHADLSMELAQLYLELKTSSSRSNSFRNLGTRNQEAELRKLANLLADSDRFGGSIGPALRSHTKHLRTRFRQQAQEKARKIGVKLIFPVFFLIFPSVILVTLGPACIMVFQEFQALLQ